jgi:hypothetical protein
VRSPLAAPVRVAFRRKGASRPRVRVRNRVPLRQEKDSAGALRHRTATLSRPQRVQKIFLSLLFVPCKEFPIFKLVPHGQIAHNEDMKIFLSLFPIAHCPLPLAHFQDRVRKRADFLSTLKTLDEMLCLKAY